jgi:hypothetical protein
MAVGSLPPEPRVMESLKQAWTNIWPSFWILVLFAVLSTLANGVGNNVGRFAEPFSPTFFSLLGLGLLLSIFLGGPLSIGLTKAHLAASRGQKPTWADFGHGFQRYWASVGLVALTTLIVLVGFLLLILPGIFYAVRLAFVNQRFVADGLGIRDSLKASYEDTRGRFWPVIGLGVLSVLLILAGLLALIVGVFVALVLVTQTGVVYWRSIREREGGAPTTPPASATASPPKSPPPAPAKAAPAKTKAPATKAAKTKTATKGSKAGAKKR